MVNAKTLFLIVLSAMGICPSGSCASICVWGTEWQSASPVLATVTLPEVGAGGSMEPVKYEIVDRGVTEVTQSLSGNLFYWKTTGLFARTVEGRKSYVRFREVMPFFYGSPVTESPNKEWLAGFAEISCFNAGDHILFSRKRGVNWGGVDEYVVNSEAGYGEIAWLDPSSALADVCCPHLHNGGQD